MSTVAMLYWLHPWGEAIMLNCHSFKKIMYCLLTLLGVILLAVSWHFIKMAADIEASISYLAPAGILFFAGFACVCFGIETYILRDDSDI